MNLCSRNALADDPGFAASAPGKTLRAQPLGFVDVGARGGVHPLVEPVARRTAVLGFEPAADECARLAAELAHGSPWARAAMEPVALAARPGTADLHVLSAATNSSLRPPNEAFTERYGMAKWRTIAREPLAVTTLDDVLFDGARAAEPFWGELIKLDTQGTEYEILRGATRTLDERCVAVVCEVSFCELYQGQRLFSEVEILLRRRGFSFYGFASLHHRSQRAIDKRRAVGRERLLYADAVFLRDPLPGGPAADLPTSERRLHVLFTAALLLGYADFALELARATWADGAEAARIEALVRRASAHEPDASLDAALALASAVTRAPEMANVMVGRFVDERRWCWDYDDVAAGLEVGHAG